MSEELDIKELIDFESDYWKNYNFVESRAAWELLGTKDSEFRSSKHTVKLINTTYVRTAPTRQGAIDLLKRDLELMASHGAVDSYIPLRDVFVNRRNPYLVEEDGVFKISWRGVIAQIPAAYDRRTNITKSTENEDTVVEEMIDTGATKTTQVKYNRKEAKL